MGAKKKTPWWALILAIAFVVIFLSMCDRDQKTPSTTPTTRTPTSTPTTTQTQWYQGGTLHRATLAQWRAATNANKLATAADWLAATEWKGHLRSPSDFDKLKVKAQMLVNAVNKVASDRDLGSFSAMETAAALLLMSNDLGP